MLLTAWVLMSRIYRHRLSQCMVFRRLYPALIGKVAITIVDPHFHQALDLLSGWPVHQRRFYVVRLSDQIVVLHSSN